MRILIVGGGPAGLYFALLTKKKHPEHDVRLVERNAPDATFGWGVVFSDKTMNYLRDADAESHDRIQKAFETWDNVDVVHRGEKISIRGNRFSGISRIGILAILQQRCREVGVAMEFMRDVTSLDALKDADLVVAADGVNSTLRRLRAPDFGPVVDVRSNKYVWYGTRRLFHGLTLTFRESPDGLFIAHSYKFSNTTSTFIVECDRATWDNGGFEKKSEEETRRILEGVFKDDLKGQPLLSNKSVWLNFQHVRNRTWWHGNTVLLGDALHTAHFSIGSGTKLALEDAIALHGAVEANSSIPAALAAFEAARRPKVEEIQAAALESMAWFENAKSSMKMDPVELAYVLMTRSGKIDHENLRKRDPAFVGQYEAWREKK